MFGVGIGVGFGVDFGDGTGADIERKKIDQRGENETQRQALKELFTSKTAFFFRYVDDALLTENVKQFLPSESEYGALKRLQYICTDFELFLYAVEDVLKIFISRGYTSQLLIDACKSFCHLLE